MILRTLCVFLCLFAFEMSAQERLYVSSGNVLTPYSGYLRPRLYVGGSYLYAITNLPQNALQSAFTDFARNPAFFKGKYSVTTSRKSSCWNLYFGYERPLASCLLVGVEIGYKDLGKKRDRNTGELNVSSNNGSKMPFRKVSSWAYDALITLRYQMCQGGNFFIKGGAALVNMRLREGSFISARNPEVSFENVYAPYSYKYRNIYPELVFGAGYRLYSCINIVASYGHIFGPYYTARYIQEPVDPASFDLIRRPNQCASYDFVTIGLEYSFGGMFLK